MSSQVLLYAGPGAHAFCTTALRNQLNQHLDYNLHTIKEISSFPDHFSDPSSISAVFVPGGNAATMICEMTETAKKSLKEFFHQYPSSYYGAGAGGVLASDQVFDTYTLPDKSSLQCMQPNPYLGIFPGKTIAPLFSKAPLGQISLTDLRLLNIRLSELTKSTFPSAHVLGPGYLNVNQITGAEILSSYDTPFMTIKSAAEKGMQSTILDQKTLAESVFYQSNGTKMILTGTFHEIDSTAVASALFKTTFKATDQEQQKIVQQMQPDDAARHSFIKKNFEKLGLNCIPD
jgi:Biotin-protein ligase, N terminal